MLQLSLCQREDLVNERTYLIPVRGGSHGVLSSQRYTAGGYNQQDGHFKVPEVHHVVTRSTHPEGEQMAERGVIQGSGTVKDCAALSWQRDTASRGTQHGRCAASILRLKLT